MEHSRPRGAPKKAPTGLKYILFVRVDKDFLPRLDRLVAKHQAQNIGLTVSRADVVRSIIYDELDRMGIPQ